MRSPLRQLSIIFLSLSLATQTTSLLIYSSPAHAQSIWETLFQRRRAEGQASGRTRGGAVRDTLCSTEVGDKSLVAIAPGNNIADTVAAHPTFFFYVPFSSTQNEDLVAEFMLITEQDRRYVLDEPLLVALPESPGIVRLQVPESLPGLEVGDRYTWYFSILCEEWELSRNPFVNGTIERVSPEQDIETWHEGLVSLTQQLPDTVETWAALLSTYDLEEFTRYPIEDMTPILDLTLAN